MSQRGGADRLEKARRHGAQQLLHVVGLGEELREVEELPQHLVAVLERGEQQRLLKRAGDDVNGAAGILERRAEGARPVAVELDDADHAVLHQQRDAQPRWRSRTRRRPRDRRRLRRGIVAVLHVAPRCRRANASPTTGQTVDAQHGADGLFVRAVAIQADEAAKHAFVLQPVDVAGDGAGRRQHEAGHVAQQLVRVPPAACGLTEIGERAKDLALADAVRRGRRAADGRASRPRGRPARSAGGRPGCAGRPAAPRRWRGARWPGSRPAQSRPRPR